MTRTFRKYCLFSLIGVVLLGGYPLYMGVRVIADMIRDGAVLFSNYPKYLIPYTPVAIAVLLSVAMMPWLFRLSKRYAQMIASISGVVLFLVTELLFEQFVIVTETAQTTLESWQMAMCYIPPDMISRCWTPVDVLIGEYSPWFKLHFYMIAVVLVLSLIHSVYGFGRQIRYQDGSRTLPLVLQTVATSLFLAMCILACFTAFYRTGELLVSPLSACLMIVFFVLLGLVVGLYIGSFCLRMRYIVAVFLPSVAACLTTYLMYFGEMFLLSGHTYQLGEGAFFEAPMLWTVSAADMLVVLGSGVLCYAILRYVRKKTVAKPDKL